MIFNFKKNKDKSVEVSNIDEITDSLAEKINAKNDEVMSLTQENERLQRELDASLVAITDREKRIKLRESVIEQLAKEYNKLEKEKESNVTKLQIKTSDFNQLNNEYKRIKNNYKELSKKKPDKKLKEINKQLVEEVITQKDRANKNYLYNKTFRFISDEQNRQTIIDNFSHNLSKWISDKNLTDTEVAKKLGTSRNIVSNLKTGKRAANVNTIQKFDIELCEYFECSVYELVTEKMEGKKNEI